MNLRDKYFDVFKQNCDDAVSLTEVKNKGYTGGSNDPFSNFRFAAQLASLPGKEPVTVEQTVLSRMADKLSRLKSLLVRPDFATADESVLDTCRDLFVYANILLIYLQLGKPGPDTVYDEDLIRQLEDLDATTGADWTPEDPKWKTKLGELFGWGTPVNK